MTLSEPIAPFAFHPFLGAETTQGPVPLPEDDTSLSLSLCGLFWDAYFVMCCSSTCHCAPGSSTGLQVSAPNKRPIVVNNSKAHGKLMCIGSWGETQVSSREHETRVCAVQSPSDACSENADTCLHHPARRNDAVVAQSRSQALLRFEIQIDRGTIL